MPWDLTLTTLQAWAAKNRPADGKRIITAAEVADQVSWAHNIDYRGCGCEEPAVAPYCSPECPLWSRSGKKSPATSPPKPPVTPVAADPMPEAFS